jgi:hypothetical protein
MLGGLFTVTYELLKLAVANGVIDEVSQLSPYLFTPNPLKHRFR